MASLVKSICLTMGTRLIARVGVCLRSVNGPYMLEIVKTVVSVRIGLGLQCSTSPVVGSVVDRVTVTVYYRPIHLVYLRDDFACFACDRNLLCCYVVGLQVICLFIKSNA